MTTFIDRTLNLLANPFTKRKKTSSSGVQTVVINSLKDATNEESPVFMRQASSTLVGKEIDFNDFSKEDPTFWALNRRVHNAFGIFLEPSAYFHLTLDTRGNRITHNPLFDDEESLRITSEPLRPDIELS